MPTSTSQTLNVRALDIGQPLPHDLIDGKGVLLLRAGVKITQGFIDTLTRRGISTVATRESDEAREAREAAEAGASTRAAASPPPRSAGPAGPAPAANPSGTELLYVPGRAPTARLTVKELHAMAHRAEQAFDSALDHFVGLGPGFVAGQITDLDAASQLVAGFQRYVAADPALVLMLLRMKGDTGQSLYRHGIKSALLAMTLTHQMGMPENQVTEAGIAALVHDLGMLRVPEPVRHARRKLTASEWLQVREHPLHTLNLLDRMGGVSDSVKTAAYQVHERCDASGYPRQRPKQFIHPLAKIIAVADTYAALTDDRPHRAALTGHDAMKVLLREVQAGKHDRAVARSLLDTMSMFPVGTAVGLSDGRAGRVLRGVPGQSVQPVVVLVKNGQPVDWELDLGQVPDLSITHVLDEAALAA
ncbi:MAG: HD domain-containing phosphohydrolase [Planctomycetota bacterium]